MKTHKRSSNSQACGEQVASEASTQPQYQQIKLALDVHAASIVVGRMIDGAKPQPPQRFKPADFLEWAKKQVALAKEVISCYEAGPTGFWLHRRLTELGVRNYVVCPTCLDERLWVAKTPSSDNHTRSFEAEHDVQVGVLRPRGRA